MAKHPPLWWTHEPVTSNYRVPPEHARRAIELAADPICRERKRYKQALSHDTGRADAKLRKFSWEDRE